MQDGLGLVFEKQGNTGAAAYNQPVLGIGQNPLDRIALQTKEQADILGAQQLEEQKQKDKLNQQALEIGGSGWEIDNDRQLGAYLKAYKTGVTDLMAKGVKPTDYTNPESKKYWEMKQGWENLKNNSLAQKEQFKKAYDIVIGDMNSPNPQFEHEQTFAKMREWQNLPIEERMKVPIESLLVKKKAPFDIYAAIRQDKPDAFSAQKTRARGDETYDASNTYNVFDEESFKLNKKNYYEKTPEGIANFQEGKANGLWDSVDEAVNVQAEQYKTTLPKDSSRSYKKKASTGSGLTEDQVRAIVDTQPTVMNVEETTIGGMGRGIKTPHTMFNPQSVSNLNLAIPDAAAYDLSKNKKGDTEKVYNLTDGTLGITLMYSDGRGLIQDLNAKENENVYVFDIGGKKVKKSLDQAIKDGDLKYVPVITGKAKYSEDDVKSIVVPADQYLNQVSGKSSQALNDAYAKLQVLKEIANQKNGVTQKTTQASLKAGQNKPATQKSNHPDYKGDKVIQNGYTYTWNPKTNSYE